jgi:hypothetical protein
MNRKLLALRKRAEAAHGIARRAVVTGAVLLAASAGQAFAALDTVAFDAEVGVVKTDIAYVGGAFLFVSIAVAVWLYLKRAAR